MNTTELTVIKNLILEELELYEEMKQLFQEKRKILVSNKADELLAVDDKLLNNVNALKSAQNHRAGISANYGKRNITLSEMTEMAKNISEDLAGEFIELREKINKLVKEIDYEQKIIAELLKHGMVMVNKTLGMISNSTALAGNYTNSGKTKQMDVDVISSIVAEV